MAAENPFDLHLQSTYGAKTCDGVLAQVTENKVRLAGLEPAAQGLGTPCSILLSYRRVNASCCNEALV